MRKTAVLLLIIFFAGAIPSYAASAPAVNAKNAILTEISSGVVLYGKKADERVNIASITKIMTVLLAMEAIDRGELKYTDLLTCSEYAASMGGSQIYAKEGEKFTVDDILKGIIVASGNDAAIIMAEHLGGTGEKFAEMMNKRAEELGMKDTHFINANGLEDDVTKHYSTARDVAVMSSELMKHKDIRKYTLIWMDTLRNGKFNLSNTNKLVKSYPGITGLKTGYTSEAMYCLVATAERDGMELCAINLGCPDTDDRFVGCAALLDYGFANYHIAGSTDAGEVVCEAKVKRGKSRKVNAVTAKKCVAVVDKKTEKPELKYELKDITAPVKKGDVIGKCYYEDGENKICETDLLAGADVGKRTFLGFISSFAAAFLGILS